MSYTYYKHGFGYHALVIDSNGDRIGYFDDFYRLSYRRIINDIGIATISVNKDHRIMDFLNDDMALEVFIRVPSDPPNSANYNIFNWKLFTGIYRDYQVLTDDNGKIYYNLIFPSTMEILSRYINAHPTGTNNKTKWTGQRLSVIANNIVQYNTTEEATVANGRLLDAPRIRNNTDDGAISGTDVVNYSADQKNVLETLKEFSGLLGFDFEVIEDGTNPFNVHTHQYAGQLGTDKSNDIVLSVYLDNVQNFTFQNDRLREKTIAIVGGTGEGLTRNFDIAFGDNVSSTNSYEEFVDAGANDTDELVTIGDRKLKELKARDKIDIDIVASNKYVIGRDYGIGDIVSVEVEGIITARKITAINMEFNETKIPIVSIEIEET